MAAPFRRTNRQVGSGCGGELQRGGVRDAADGVQQPDGVHHFLDRPAAEAAGHGKRSIAGDFDVPRACADATQFKSAPTDPPAKDARPQACRVGALVFSSGQRP